MSYVFRISSTTSQRWCIDWGRLFQAELRGRPDRVAEEETMKTKKFTLLIAMSLFCALAMPVWTAAKDDPKPTVRQAVTFDVSPPLRELAQPPVSHRYILQEPAPRRPMPHHGATSGPIVDQVEQTSVTGVANYSVGLNLQGLIDKQNLPLNQHEFIPASQSVAVGDTQIFQSVNIIYEVLDKNTGNVVAGPFNGASLWTGFGGPCEASGVYGSFDPTAQWDKAAHRWFMAYNTHDAPYYACIAVSTTPDATGSYYRFAYSLGDSPGMDTTRFGTWTTSYGEVMSTGNDVEYTGPQVCVYERAKILAGDSAAQQVCFQLSNDGYYLLPADIDSNLAPPAGQDQFFIGSVGAVDNSHLSLYSVHIDWSNPGGATITGDHNSQLVAIPAFTPACNGTYYGFCVPEPGGHVLESDGDNVMYRFAYWEDQPVVSAKATPPKPLPSQHWYVNFDVTASGGQNAPRWLEFTAPIKKVAPTDLHLFQSGTYAPDSTSRWMGSMTRDKAGDVLLGYNISSASMYPSVAVAGRTVADPLGTLEPEVLVFSGTGSMNATENIWGHHSDMAIDGSDGCTFWYTQEYYTTDFPPIFAFYTRIASFKFSNCH